MYLCNVLCVYVIRMHAQTNNDFLPDTLSSLLESTLSATSVSVSDTSELHSMRDPMQSASALRDSKNSAVLYTCTHTRAYARAHALCAHLYLSV